jgi:DHA1 family tetracycline resistance protein-like MFS transporter
VAGLALAFVFTSLAQRGLENVWILYMGYRFDWDERINGLVLGLVGLSAAIVQGGLVRPIVNRIGERRAILFGLSVSSLAFLGYGLAPQGWMIPVIILFGSLGGIAGPAIQSIVAHQVDSREQGKVQGALTSLMSLTSIVAPLVFTAGLFSYFTSPDAVISLPSAPFLVGSALFASALLIVRGVFRRFPAQAPDDQTT